jgi:hypothetical protein
VGSLCLGSFVWGNGTALLGGGARINQFKVTETVGTTTTTTSTTQATSSFPVNGDVTPYGMATDANDAPGDLYVEGSTPSSLALVAQDDVVITNSLSASNPPSNAVEVVAQNNVRVYHPVGCTSTDGGLLAATTAGFCPNDVTGLYSGVLATAARPDQQYANLAADQKNGAPLTDLAIHAAVFALGNASTNCPEPTGGGGFCGGEFTTDNYNRGDGLGTLTVTGGVYMAHHGPVGQEWEVSDTSGQTSRPYSGYHLTLQYQDLTAAITAITANAVVPLTEVSSSVWRIVSISQGTAS